MISAVDMPIEKPPTVHSVGGFVVCATIPLTAREQTMWSVRKLTVFPILAVALCGSGTATAFDETDLKKLQGRAVAIIVICVVPA